MANLKTISEQPVRLSNPAYADHVIWLANVGAQTVWYSGDTDRPGIGMPLVPGEQALIAGAELFVVATTNITDPRSTTVVDEDWGARIAWEVRPR